MSRGLYTLVLAQFLSAFGDNAILFTVIAMALGGVSQVWMAKGVLLIIGIRGGMFVAPVNAAIQDIGRRGVGSGSAVAVQNFFQNSAILLCMGLYSIAAARGVGTSSTIFCLGGMVLLMTLMIARSLPRIPVPHP